MFKAFEIEEILYTSIDSSDNNTLTMFWIYKF